MISSLGTETIAAIGASNKLLTIYNAILYGSCSGCAMFMTQYWGEGNTAGLRKIFGVLLTVTIVGGGLFSALVLAIPDRLIMLFNDDPIVVEQAVAYMRAVVPAYFLMAIIFPLEYLLRSMNKVRLIMINTIASTVINIVANYVLIFGKFGFPAMGVTGAALGTVLCRVAALVVLVIYLAVSRNEIVKKPWALFRLERRSAAAFTKKAIPMVGNEIMWQLGTTIYFIIYGKAGTDALAAMSIMQTLQQLSKIVSGSFCGASSIIIGNQIGMGDLELVQRNCRRFHVTALIVGIISCAVVLLLIKPVLLIYGVADTQVGTYVAQCMVILSIFILMNACNSINVEGIFRSGGDVGWVTLMDMGSIWLIGMPFTIITGLVMNLDIVIVYSAWIVLELYKLPLGFFRFRSGKWLHRLSQNSQQQADT